MNKIMIKLIKIYKNYPSKIHNVCRFTPTCSSYALEAYENYNFFKATYLIVKRLLKCRPFGKFGYDPVPKKENKNEKTI